MRRIIMLIAICLLFLPARNSYPGEKARQEIKTAVNNGPGGADSAVRYGGPDGVKKSEADAGKEIATAMSAMNKQLSSCLDATIAFQKQKLEELNKKLAYLYAQNTGVPSEEAAKWARDVVEKSPDVKKGIEELDKTREEYNKERAKNLMAEVYGLLAYVFETVDSRLIALRDLDSRISYEMNNRFEPFSDSTSTTGTYTSRTVFLPKGNRVIITVIMGRLNRGLVETCPTIRFSEVLNQTTMQSFDIATRYAGFATRGSGTIQYKEKEPVVKDVMYSVTERDMLTKDFKERFDTQFGLFLKIAYGR